MHSITNSASKGLTTNQEASGKFQQKLLYKQKLLEEQMIENRVRKLKMEEERLRRQIKIANKHSQLADDSKGHHE